MTLKPDNRNRYFYFYSFLKIWITKNMDYEFFPLKVVKRLQLHPEPYRRDFITILTYMQFITIPYRRYWRQWKSDIKQLDIKHYKEVSQTPSR